MQHTRTGASATRTIDRSATAALALFLLCLAGTTGSLAAAGKTVQTLPTRPILFSHHSSSPDSRWLSTGLNYSFALTPSQASMVVGKRGKSASIQMSFAGGSNSALTGIDPQSTQLHVLKGNDPGEWSTGNRTWARVRQNSVYPGIDVVYYGTEDKLEYDLVVAPRASASRAQLTFTGARSVKIDENGALVLDTDAGPLRWRAPVAWQDIRGTRKPVAARYRLTSANSVQFDVGSYDRSQPLIIDPVFEFSRLYGGTGTEQTGNLSVDAAGNAYIVGATNSSDFPLINALGSGSKSPDGFVMKIGPKGDIIWASLIGGSQEDVFFGVSVDKASGNIFVTGVTQSTDFPRTIGSAGVGGYEAIALKISSAGDQILFSRLLSGSGSDTGLAAAAGNDGTSWFAGSTTSTNFPLASPVRSVPGGTDGFVTRLSATGDIQFSTLVGGASNDLVSGLAKAPNGDVWFVMNTRSTDITSSGLRTSAPGGDDCFVGKYAGAGSSLLYGSYLGGSKSDSCGGVAVDSNGLPVVSGSTLSSDFPVANAIQPTFAGGSDAFVSKLNAAGTGFVFSTFLGGARNDGGNAVSVDSDNNVYVAGYTGGRFPVTSAVKPQKTGSADLVIRGTNGTFVGIDTGLGEVDSIRVLARDALNSQVLVGAQYNRLFRTANGGASWTEVNTSMGSINEIIPAPVAGNTFFAAAQNGLYKSTDSGINWTRIYSAGAAVSVAVHPTDINTIYVAAASGVIKTINGGSAWTTALNTTTANSLRLDPRNPQIIIVATNDGALRSSNGGASFSVVASGVCQLVRFAPSNLDVVYLFSSDQSLRSSNNGLSFTPITKSPVDGESVWAVDMTNASVIYAGSDWQGLYKSVDSGQTWAQASSVYGDSGFAALEPMPDGSLVAGLVDRSDAFAVKLNAAGSAIVYSTYIGGATDDVAYGIAAGPGGAWVGGDGFFTFPVNGSQETYRRRGFDTFLVKISEAEAPCFYEVQSGTLQWAPAGGINVVTILTGSGCNWTATTGSPWIHLTTAASGTGSSSVTFSVDANPGASRTDTITIAGKTFTILQTGVSCTYALTPSSVSPTAAGAVTDIQLTTGSACVWAVRSDADWITWLTATSGSGPATLRMSVAPNIGAARSGTVTVGTASVQFQQAGAPCGITLGKTSDTAAAAGSSGSFTVTTNTGCAYSVSSSASWLTINSAPNASGSSTVAWTATANNTGTGRQATITVGGRTIQIVQSTPAAAGCTFTPSMPSISAGADKQAGTFTITASAPNCTWSYPPLASWVQFFPLTGTGSATISYSIFPNIGTANRTSVAFFPGATVTITQSGNTLSEDERFVIMLYSNFFGRQPTPAEVAFQVSALKGGLARDALLLNFYNSQEFNLGGRFVAGLYLGLLARDAEFGGWLFQRNALAQGQVTQLQLVSNFLNAAEYGLRFGNPSNAEFVRLLYRYILLREGADDEVAFQAGALGSISRVQMASNFLNAAEFQQKLGPRMTSFLIYACILSRGATQAELDSVASVIAANPANAQVQVSAFTNSNELKTILQ